MSDDAIRSLVEERATAVGKNLASLSKAIGKNHAYLQQFVRRGTPRFLPEDVRESLAPLIGLHPDELRAIDAAPRQRIHFDSPEPSTAVRAPNAPGLSDLGDFDVPVLGIAVGGEDDEFYFNGEVIDHFRRPPGLKRARNVFVVYVTGESMVPRYEPGEAVYVQKAAAAPGDYVLVEMYGEDEGRAGHVFIKQLVSRNPRAIVCRQFNPPKEMEFPAGEVKDVFRVLKTRDLLG